MTAGVWMPCSGMGNELDSHAAGRATRNRSVRNPTTSDSIASRLGSRDRIPTQALIT
jgi:hypothetical protein